MSKLRNGKLGTSLKFSNDGALSCSRLFATLPNPAYSVLRIARLYGRRTQGIGKVIQNAEDDIVSEETRIKRGEFALPDGIVVDVLPYESSVGNRYKSFLFMARKLSLNLM